MSGLSTSRPTRLRVLLLASLVVSTTALAARANPTEPCQPAVVCAVAVADLPAVVLGSGDYELVAGRTRTALPRSGVAYLALTERTTVRLDGAAYHGSVSVDPADCGGEAVHTIAATMKPARLEFQAGAVPLRDLVISCVDGCPYQLRPADDFPELPFPRETNELAIELEFKARGHRPETAEYRLSPGTNQIRVTLTRID